jgi:hypothetical protein
MTSQEQAWKDLAPPRDDDDEAEQWEGIFLSAFRILGTEIKLPFFKFGPRRHAGC